MARKTQALSFLTGTLTQGGNDAFVQLSIATALTGQTKTSYRLASLEVELPAVILIENVDYQLSLTRKSYSAMPTSMILEKSNIWYWRNNTRVVTSVGYSRTDRILRYYWNDTDAPIIVEDPIYAQFDTAATAATNVAYIRLGYWMDTISEVDKLTLVANSLS